MKYFSNLYLCALDNKEFNYIISNFKVEVKFDLIWNMSHKIEDFGFLMF